MNIAVFASGNGSNFQAILHAIRQGTLAARVTLLVCNKSTAGALSIARAHQVPALHLGPLQFPNEDAYVDAVLDALRDHSVQLIALAGYLKKIPRRLVEEYRHRILNIHPALLPRHGGHGMHGLRVHEAVLSAGDSESGATVHFVDEEYDRGPIVLQRSVVVFANDTPETLAARVLTVEHTLYPEALQAFVEQRVIIEQGTVWIRPPSHNETTTKRQL
jgi:phosphoribosylglycinamide formyltransferase 1